MMDKEFHQTLIGKAFNNIIKKTLPIAMLSYQDN